LLCCGLARAEIFYQQVHALNFRGPDGSSPQARLLIGADGKLYGTTAGGGTNAGGTIFGLNSDGSEFRTLHHFGAIEGDGVLPFADLMFGRDGAIYGTTERGGTTNNHGTIFKIQPDGSNYEVLFRFTIETGSAPRGHLVEGPDGYLYGTTQGGGIRRGGTIYKIRPDGTDFRVLHAFTEPTPSSPGDGADCDTGLTLGSDGLLYGVTSWGGDFLSGTVFRLAPDGSEYQVLHHFDMRNGWEPEGQLLELSNGVLYGTTELSYESGFRGSTIYRINMDGSGFEVLKFIGPDDADRFLNGLVLGGDGALYGSLVSGPIKIRPDGSGFQVLHRFGTSVGDGYGGYGLTLGLDGALYGATSGGGIHGDGTVYRITTDGTEYSILHHFRHETNTVALPRASLLRTDDGVFFGTSEAGGGANAGTIFSVRANGSDARWRFSFGIQPNDGTVPNGLCHGGDGFLYGTTFRGGNSNVGTVFRIDQNGSNYSVIRHLGPIAEPRSPRNGLIKGADGWLYGTTLSGGSANRGTVYKVNNDGELIVLHSLTASEGDQPQCELVQSAAGSLYGTALLGGTQNFGTVYKVEPDGGGFTVLHEFMGGAEGQNPMSGLMIASDGRLYGTTARRTGAFAGCIYRLNTDGSGFQVLKSFPLAGSGPKAPKPVLVEAPDGLLYGAAQSGGATDKGAIFRIGKDGDRFEVLHEFGLSGTDGQTPSAAFTPVGDGSFLGVTEAGGQGNGTIFRFDPIGVRLRISMTPTTAELRWPTSSTVDSVEATPGVNGFDWHPTGVPVTRSGDENHASVPRQPAGQFFRVRRLWP